MQTLKILAGIPGSGKTTWAREMIDDDTIWLSSDSIRAELFGSEEDQSNNGLVFNEMFKRTVAALSNGKDAIYDATNLNSKRRENLIKEIRHTIKERVLIYAYVFATPYPTCIERNNARARVVPEYAMERMYKSFQVPAIFEGFDSVFLIKNSTPDYSTLDLKLSDSYEVSHDNPHHSYNIGKHCVAASDYIFNNKKRILKEFDVIAYQCLYEAARYHDIGKPFCKVFHNVKGVPTDTAHYYGHENVGAYDYLAYCLPYMRSCALDIAFLINYHMVFYRDDKSLERFKNKIGEYYFRALEYLHEADMAAH